MAHLSPQRGFTILELLIICVILGLLAITAIPGFHKFVVREQVNEGVRLTAGLRDSVSLYHAKEGAWPTLNDLVNGPAVVDSSVQYVKAITLGEKGVIEIAYGGQKADPKISGRVLELVPYVGPNGDAVWRCQASPGLDTSMPSELLPGFCQGYED
jgi:type IV pilus assembly protein PilA